MIGDTNTWVIVDILTELVLQSHFVSIVQKDTLIKNWVNYLLKRYKINYYKLKQDHVKEFSTFII